MLASAAHTLKLEQYREAAVFVKCSIFWGASLVGLDGKESACNAGDLGSTPGLGRSLGGGHGNPLPVFLPRQSPWREGLEDYVHTAKINDKPNMNKQLGKIYILV